MILDILFPPSCIFCSKLGKYVCTSCRSNLFRTIPHCYCCKKLSSGYTTHTECRYDLNIDFAISEWIENRETKRLDILAIKNISGLPQCLLELSIKNSRILNFQLLPIKDKYYEFNKKLVKELNSKKVFGSQNNSVLIGYEIPNQDILVKQISPRTVGLYTLFTRMN